MLAIDSSEFDGVARRIGNSLVELRQSSFCMQLKCKPPSPLSCPLTSNVSKMQANTVEDYIAQGYTRIQAIKVFYEHSVRNTSVSEKRYQQQDFENGVVKSNVEKFTELGRSKVIEVQRGGKVWRMPMGSKLEDFEKLRSEGKITLAPTREEEIAEQQRATQEGRIWMPPIVIKESEHDTGHQQPCEREDFTPAEERKGNGCTPRYSQQQQPLQNEQKLKHEEVKQQLEEQQQQQQQNLTVDPVIYEKSPRYQLQPVRLVSPTSKNSATQPPKFLSAIDTSNSPRNVHNRSNSSLPSYDQIIRNVRQASSMALPSHIQTFQPSYSLTSPTSNNSNIKSPKNILPPRVVAHDKKTNKGVPLDLAPMSKVHTSIFHEDEDDEEDDADLYSICDGNPTQENIDLFLRKVIYNEDELEQFTLLLQQGFDIDQAADTVFQRRLNMMEDEGRKFVDLIDERLPIRYTAFSGNRSDDLEMLLERKYSLSQANHILDLIYANRYGIPLNRRNIVPHQISLISSDDLSFCQRFPVDKIPEKRLPSTNFPSNKSLAQQNGLPTPPPIVIPPIRPPSVVYQRPQPEEIPQDSPQWYKAFNFDARRGLLRAALNMNSDYDTSEHEALRIGLIISQQEAQFGVNMYDALLPHDEPAIEELVNKDHTLDEAVMCIFEARFGKMKPISPSAMGDLRQRSLSDAVSTNSNSRKEKISPSVRSIASDEISYVAADNLESEIALLVLSGYSRDTAVKILLERKCAEEDGADTKQSPHSTQSRMEVRRLSTRSSAGSPVTSIQRQNSSTRSRGRSMDASQHEQANQSTGSPLYQSHYTLQQQAVACLSMSQNTELDDDDISQVTEPTMIVPPGHLLGPNGQSIPSRNSMSSRGLMPANRNQSISQNPPVYMNNSISSHPQMPAMMHRSPVAGVPSRSPTNMLTPPSSLVGSSLSPNITFLPKYYNANRPPHLHIYDRQTDRNLCDISADERALRIGLMVSEQEATFGINMYDNVKATDEKEIKQLVVAGYNEDEAVLILFEKKYGPSKSQLQHQQSMAPLTRQQSTMMYGHPASSRQMPMPMQHSQHQQQQYTTMQRQHSLSTIQRQHSLSTIPMEAPRQHQQFANQTQQRTFVQTPSMIHPDCAMNTRREIERPGAIKVPGTGSRNMQAAVGTGSMNRDVTNLPVENIQLLCNMGFTRNQAIYALQEKNNNVAEAADLLLTAS